MYRKLKLNLCCCIKKNFIFKGTINFLFKFPGFPDHEVFPNPRDVAPFSDCRGNQQIEYPSTSFPMLSTVLIQGRDSEYDHQSYIIHTGYSSCKCIIILLHFVLYVLAVLVKCFDMPWLYKEKKEEI